MLRDDERQVLTDVRMALGTGSRPHVDQIRKLIDVCHGLEARNTNLRKALRECNPEDEPAPAGRKIVQIAALPETSSQFDTVLALCDDGSLWWLVWVPEQAWHRFPEIPEIPE